MKQVFKLKNLDLSRLIVIDETYNFIQNNPVINREKQVTPKVFPHSRANTESLEE